jgi:hypothetical protein
MPKTEIGMRIRPEWPALKGLLSPGMAELNADFLNIE